MYFRRIFLIVTEACDSRCKLCDYWLLKSPKSLSEDFCNDVLPQLIERNGIQLVCISGGEPTLHPQLPQIVRQVADAGAKVTLTTSTTRLDQHYSAIKNRVDHYLVSLDGVDRQTYETSRGIDHFDETINWLKRLVQDQRSQVAVSCVLQKANAGQVREMYRLARSLGVHRLFFRVPELKDETFGRKGCARRPSEDTSVLTPDEVAQLGDDLRWFGEQASQDGRLGQSPKDLERKIAFFDARARGKPYREPDALCDVPLTSFVVDPDTTIKPCFYLPHRQTLAEGTVEVGQGPAFAEVYDGILNHAQFRKRWCNSCHQFDGHKHLMETA